jgi:non-specific serine/threonine protein kinase
LVVLGAAGRVVRLRQPGVVELDITPAGEVFVNGASRGSSPPLRRFELPAGKYELEVRSGRHKPLVIELELEAGERVTVVHSFTSPRATRSFKQRVFEFFR